MRTVLDNLIKPILAAVFAIVTANCEVGCRDVSTPEASYGAAQAVCASTASDLQKSCMCRLAVDRAYLVCESPTPTDRCTKGCE